MIVQKPADLDPAMKSALKNHIMRKRQQLKQELEQDAIEKRLKREQEAKRKQDAMTLDQLKEQLSQLEKTLENLRNEKHSLFAQLKQNMRVLNEDDTRRKQKEGEMNAARLQQNEQNRMQQQQAQPQQPPQQPQQQQHQQATPSQLQTIQPQQQTQHQHQPVPPLSQPVPHLPQVTSNGAHPTNISNQENHIRDKPFDLQNQQPHLYHQQQANHHEQDTLPANSHPLHQPPATHLQRPNSMFNSAAFSQLLNAHSFPRQSPYLTHLSQSSRSSNPYGPMSPYPSLSHHQPPSLISGHGIPTSLPHVQQTSPMIRPSPSPLSNTGQSLSGQPKLPLNLPISNSGQPGPLDFNPNLATSTAHQMQQQAINSSAATTAALGIPYGSPYFNSSSPIGPPISSHQVLEHHAALNAAAAAAVAASNHNHLMGNNGNNNNSGNSNNNINNAPGSSSRGNPLPQMKRPISATSLANDTISPNKKIHTQPQTQNPPHQLQSSLPNPYLAYPGLPPGLGSAGGGSLPASLFGQNLMRTPPPPNITSLINSAAFSHLLNAHNFPRQSPYLTHIPQPNRTSNPYGPMSPYPPLGHHPPASLISGHGIPTSMPHVPQNNPMIRPSPPPPMSNPGQSVGSGPPKMPLSLPMTSSGQPGPLDFNPNLVTSSAHQMQQQARAAAAAAALGIAGYGSPYFNSNSPIGPPPSQF